MTLPPRPQQQQPSIDPALFQALVGMLQQSSAKQPTDGKSSEVTPLTPEQEKQFRRWVKKNKITDVDDPRSFYDYRGAFLAGVGSEISPVDNQPHWPDTFKQHGHPTFSVESQYSKGIGDGGMWQGETFIPEQQVKLFQALIKTMAPPDVTVVPRPMGLMK